VELEIVGVARRNRDRDVIPFPEGNRERQREEDQHALNA
jgi:hypothetical protein